MQTRTFIYTDDKSNKFWTIALSADAKAYTVTYGKTGTAGQTLTKDFPTAETCQKAADKLITEKTGKGYVEQSGSDGTASGGTGSQPMSTKAAGPTHQLVEYNFGSSDHCYTLDLAVDLKNEQGIENTLRTISTLFDDDAFVKKLHDRSPTWRFGIFANGTFTPEEPGDFNSEYEFYNRAFKNPALLPLMEDIVKKIIREDHP